MKLQLINLSKSYGSLSVLSGLTINLEAPGIYCLMAPSGSGKTTLFRLLLGLEQPDSGQIICDKEKLCYSAVFQEDRLIEHLPPIENLSLVLGKNMDRMQIKKELLSVLPEEALSRPVSILSGGMRRRVAFMRGMLADSDIVIMDEPFTGLDETNKSLVVKYLLEHQGNRLFLISTHEAEDIKQLGGICIGLE